MGGDAATGGSLAFPHKARVAYSLAFGSLLLIGGRIADLIGRKTALVIGLVGFTFASALAGAAAKQTAAPTRSAGAPGSTASGALRAPSPRASRGSDSTSAPAGT